MSKPHRPEIPGQPTNKDRAIWADRAMTEFCRQVYGKTFEEDETRLGDLLCDLMHWADEKGVSFDLALERGKSHYEAEKEENG